MIPRWGSTPTDRQSQYDFDSDFEATSRVVAVESEESSFGAPAWGDRGLGAEDLKWVEPSELAVAENWQEMN
jgi:hypothetical protein